MIQLISEMPEGDEFYISDAGMLCIPAAGALTENELWYVRIAQYTSIRLESSPVKLIATDVEERLAIRELRRIADAQHILAGEVVRHLGCPSPRYKAFDLYWVREVRKIDPPLSLPLLKRVFDWFGSLSEINKALLKPLVRMKVRAVFSQPLPMRVVASGVPVNEHFALCRGELWAADIPTSLEQWEQVTAERREVRLRKMITCERTAIPEAVRHEVWRRDGGRCVKCSSQQKLEFDHVIPLSKGGSDTARNLQLLCEACNRAKGATIG